MKKMIAIWGIVLTFAVSCTKQTKDEPDNPSAEPASIRFTDSASVPQITSANTEFAFELFHQLEEGDNIFFSPYSVSLALMLVYAGAENLTESELATVLNLPYSKQSVHNAYKMLSSELSRENKGITINIANSVWTDDDISLMDQYSKTVELYYQSEVRQTDFAQSASAAETINGWVADQTENKIDHIIDASALNAMTRFVVVNAVYFYGQWENPFSEAFTKDGPFNLSDGTTVITPLMNDIAYRGFLSNDLYQAVELNYKEGQFSMIAIVPSIGEYESIRAELSAEFLEKVIDGMEKVRLDLTFPKFEYSDSIDLGEILSGMGLGNLFSDTADLSGIDGTVGGGIDQAVHMAYVSVDEEGTTAAAATALIAVTGISMDTIYALKIDRPFFYMIRDKTSESVLFIGEMRDPGR